MHPDRLGRASGGCGYYAWVWFAVAGFVILVVMHYLAVTSRQGWASAEAVAVMSMLGMTAGLVYYGDSSSVGFIIYSCLCYSACIAGMLVAAAWRKPVDRVPRPISPGLWTPTNGMWLVLVLCLLLTAWYFVAAGAVPLLAGLQNVVQGTSNNVRDLRASTYQGGSYLAPGYINQVKNVLLPALISVVVVYLWHDGRLLRRVAAVILGVVGLVALFGTGQRTFGVVFFAALLGAYSMIKGGVRKSVLIKAAVPFLIVFAVATAALGRSETKVAEAANTSQVVSIYLGEVMQRFFYGQQVSALAAEQVVADWDIPFMSDWVTTTLGYLPGRSDANSIAGSVGRYYTGSDASTMPPSSVTSARLNLTSFGAVVFFFLWGIFLALITRWLLAKTAGAPLYFIGASGLMFTLGAWVSDAPIAQLQWGALMFAVVAFVGIRQYRRFVQSERPAAKVPIRGANVSRVRLEAE